MIFLTLMMFQVQSKVGFQIFMSPYLLVLEYQAQFTKDFRSRLNTKKVKKMRLTATKYQMGLISVLLKMIKYHLEPYGILINNLLNF